MLSICVYCGLLTGATDNSNAMVAKQIEPVIMANTSMSGLVKVTPNPMATSIGTMEIIIPTRAYASISPKSIVHMAIGAEINRSSVLFVHLTTSDSLFDLLQMTSYTQSVILVGEYRITK